ncbi:ERG8, Phosphomevalonate kinase [Lineolata rhizophorae]|uniref:Phosphomevalonate kinase n=1 Tax=Lineolata rhizophorae TaxID=578093 RepID=A0A6A6PAI6_9PEZI|nr:ERG8, Phosphomevalonate kinase [Lineolata rhizophorae]
MGSHSAAQAGETAVSAPGKVLLAGGYLVLDRDYTGLVFGLDARIHVVVQPVKTIEGVALREITVKSPQFTDATWEYGYSLSELGGGIKVTQLRASASLALQRNIFIETTLSYVLTYISTISRSAIPASSITILADNDYYSHPSSTITHDQRQAAPTPRSRFHTFHVPVHEAHKTGLGSSAALVTALTAALLAHYLPPRRFRLADQDPASSRRRLHNLAQAAHCAAQGKVGSGFDVAAAVYGSCLYRRFSAGLLAGLPEPGAQGFARRLAALVDEEEEEEEPRGGGDGVAWDGVVERDRVRIPRGVRLVMADVDCGSQTPGMVKKVLGWREGNAAEARRLWGLLQARNEALAEELVRLAAEDAGGAGAYDGLRRIIAGVRELIREMSAKTGVPIEPKSQTALLDACAAVPGVIDGLVPGAGGYDAIALLVEDREEVLEGLREFLKGWEGGASEEEGGKIGKVSMLGVREDMEGVRAEDPAEYKEWLT